MSIFSGFESVVRKNVPLADFTWYKLGGSADYFIQPKSVEQLRDIVVRCKDNNVPIYVLGFGSNLLISDKGVRGAVIRLDAEAFCGFEFKGTLLQAGAGVNLNKMTLEAVRKGLSGLEALTGIPGSVGGAVRMNAGGSYGDIGSCVQSVTLMDKDGNIFEKEKPELVFDYRWTNITAPLVLSATMELTEADPNAILKTVKEIFITKKNSQPLPTRNAGCVFKNPRGMSAGALIDRAGLKGSQIGGAVVSEKHANFIVAETGCSAEDVKRLIELIQQRVKEAFDVELELELEIW